MDQITPASSYKKQKRARQMKWISTAMRYAGDMARYIPVWIKYRSRTMIWAGAYLENLALARLAFTDAALDGGAVAECGTWKGGMAAGLIEAGGKHRRYFFFDSFEGLPPAEDIDGAAAKDWQADTSSPAYYDNCTASLAEFRQTIAMTGCPPENIEVHKGFFEHTFSAFDPPPLAVLRLDADWYAPTLLCLQKFWDRMMPGGIILIDDYYDWEGCAKAVHDFLAAKQAAERIYQGPIGRVAFIIKRAER